jgi:protease-4
MAVRTGWVFTLLAVFLVAGAGLVALGVWLGGERVSVKPSSTLVLDLASDIQEDIPPSARSQFFYDDSPTLWETVASVRYAARDERIETICLKMRGIEWGWAKLDELRDALAEFQEADKRVVCWMEGGGEKDYYLASIADDLYMPSTSFLRVDGFAAYISFFKGTLDHIGVVADLENIGEYKNAAEPLTRKNMSEPSRREMNLLIDERFDDFLASTAEARGWTVAQMREKVDAGPYRSQEAMAAGLVDSLLSEEEVLGLLPGGEDGNRVDLEDYMGVASRGGSSAPRIAIVFATGTIVSGKSGMDPVWGRTLGHESFAKSLRDARDDDKVRAIVLRVDSPGGDTYASNQMWHEVARAAEVKPVIASFSDVAASGGYYLAMGADTLVAQPGTVTGSIGVIGGKFNVSGLYQRLGMNVEVLSRGRNAEIFSPMRNFTPSEREKYVAQLWDEYREFVQIVAANRMRGEAEIESLARGRVYSGGLALEKGLVDTLGGFETAIGLAKSSAEIEPDQEVRVVLYPHVQRTFLNRLVSQLFEESDAAATSWYLPGLDVVRSLSRLAGSVSWTWMPYSIEWR